MEEPMAHNGSIDRRAFMGAAGMAGLMAFAAPMRAGMALAGKLEPIKLNTLALSANTIKVFDILLAEEGMLEEAGVQPTSLMVSDGTKVIAGLVSGAGLVCMQAGFAQMMPAIAKGAKLKVIAGAGLRPQTAIYSKRADINSAEDLIGKTVGIGALGSLLHSLVVALMRKKGLDYTKVNFVNVGSASDVFKAIVAGKVDAGPGDLAFFDNPGKYGLHVLKDGALWTEIPEYVNQASVTTDAAIEQNGESVIRMLVAYRRLYQFLHGPKSQEPFRRAFVKATGGHEEEAAT
jgi:ABC-type nitrate/sulfonate/bicarbonate transport system substrate-binding protein